VAIRPPAAPSVVAVDMGYGHLRAARALADAAGVPVREADRGPLAGPLERAVWTALRESYGALSRLAGSGRGGRGPRLLLDALTGIPRGRAGGALAAPTGPVRALAAMGRAGLGRGLLRELDRTGSPLVATFYAQAILADAAGREPVWLVVTDSDVNRVWVPERPDASRIGFLVPCRDTARRLRSYGVPPRRIRVTGFPLPPALLGGTDLPVLRRDLAARLARLDPGGAFRARRGADAEASLGPLPPPFAGGPPTVVFSVGGSGAQASLAEPAIRAFRGPVERGEFRLALVAGIHPGVAVAFRRWLADAGLREGQGVEVLVAPDFAAYEPGFNRLLARADVLWTKPGELVFFAALGLPLLLAPPLGVHERRNRRAALRWGIGLDGRAPGAVPARLSAALADGSLAETAWRAFRRLPKRGTYRILDIVSRHAGT